MRTFAHKQKPIRQTESAGSVKPARSSYGQGHKTNATPSFYRATGNHLVRRLLQAGAGIQPKLFVNTSGREADRVADQQGNTGRSQCEQGAGQVRRKEREKSPAIDPDKPAESWFYADDPIGHVASVYFDTASAELDLPDQAVLNQVNPLLADPDPPTGVTFEGYTDSVGDPVSNQALSERRAGKVAAWFALPSPHTTVKTTGLGEQGPESTGKNANALSHYRRVDVIIRPPRPTTPIEPPEGSGTKYGSPKLKHEIKLAVDALDATLAALLYAQSGMPAPETSAALERYFPHPRYRSADFLGTLHGEILHIRNHIESIRYREVGAGDLSIHCPTDYEGAWDIAWDRKLCRAIRGAIRLGTLAFPFPFDKPEEIVLMPNWPGHNNPASILVHETAHFLLGLKGHPTEVPHRNPTAIQGFVAKLGGLAAPLADRLYPAP